MLKTKQNEKQARSSLLFNNCLTFHCTYCLLIGEVGRRGFWIVRFDFGTSAIPKHKAPAEQPFLYCDLCFVGTDTAEPREVL